MSKFVIGNKPISRVSGPSRVCVLKPDDALKKKFEENGSRLPYIILFGDYHFGKENNCEECKCLLGDCCYEIDDSEFLKLFDGVSSKNYPVDFYIEQTYEPRLNDPNIYSINPYMKTYDNEGYLSKFLSDYNICYSKTEKEDRTARYKKECPTRDVRWHYIDTRIITYGNTGDFRLTKGSMVFFQILKIFFNIPDYNSKIQINKLVNENNNELQLAFDILNNGLNFLKTYVTIDSDFLVAKQVRKQVLEEYRNMDFWHNIIADNIKKTYNDFFKISSTPFIAKDYIEIVKFYIDIFTLISYENIPKEEFLKRRKELVAKGLKYNIFEDNAYNINNILTLTVKTAMMDIYTVARMLKKPDGTPGFLSMYYAGDNHTENIKDILVKYFSYKIVGESNTENERCQIVKHIDFNILKAKREYK